MKKSIGFLLFSVFSISFLVAQDCSNAFYAVKKGTKTTMTHFNDKGKITSITEGAIKSFENTASGFAATVESKVSNEKGKVLVEGKTYEVKCEAGVLKLDISSMYMADFAQQAKSMEVQISGKALEMPSTLSEGMTLPDGNTEIKMGSGGMMFMTMTFDIKNRKVEKKESITVPAGTFECYKITYDMDTKMLVKRNLKVVQWLAAGVGLVKSENFNAKGERESYSELTKLEKP
jgi:hypothetical protein